MEPCDITSWPWYLLVPFIFMVWALSLIILGLSVDITMDFWKKFIRKDDDVQ